MKNGINNMYHKLVVSSLEFRAQSGDLKACAELVSRAKNGLRRATLAIERLLARKIPQEACDILSELRPGLRVINLLNKMDAAMDPAGQDSWHDIEQVNRYHSDGRKIYSAEVKQIEREEFERYGNLTAQEIMNRNR